MGTATVNQSTLKVIMAPSAHAAGSLNQSTVKFILGGLMPTPSCNNPPDGSPGIPYAHTFTATFGHPPYTWSITGGALPTGLSLNAATGIVTGIPNAPGTFTFTLTVTDTTPRSSSIVCSITINGMPVVGQAGGRFKPCLHGGAEWIAAQLAENLRLERAKRLAWPYSYEFPPAPAITVDDLGDIVAPLQDGNLHTILQYQVPSGFQFWMDAILLDCPRPFLPGDFQFVVDINAEVTGSTQASRIQGLVSVPVPLGSFISGRTWPFRMPYLFEPLTVIRCKVMNNNVVPGAPNYFVAGLFGFLLPWEKGDLL